MKLTFRVAKLLAYANQQTMLDRDTNPFALIVKAHLQTIATRGHPEDRRNEKFRLVKQLLQSKMPKDDIRIIFGLLDWMMDLPEDLEEAFEADLRQYETGNTMEYVTSIERVGYRRGLMVGIDLLLEAKFGTTARPLMKQVRALKTIADVEWFAKALKKKTTTLERAREYLENPPSARS